MTSLRATDHGCGTFTTEVVAEGKTICKFGQPILQAIHSEHLSNTCDHCLRAVTDDGTLGSCQGCNIVHYCGQICQREAWTKHHKLECKILRRFSCKDLPDAYFRAILCGALLKDSGYITKGQWKNLLQLCTNEDDFERETKQNISAMASTVKKIGKTKIGMAQLETLFYVMWCNAVEIHDVDNQVVGVELYTALARKNHSCEPNARFLSAVCTPRGRLYIDAERVEADRTGWLKAMREIEKDEEITISYIDNELSVRKRQELLARWHFVCACRKCMKELAQAL